ncbi:hypothetical protein ACJMK2_002141 [Sinanodonta woodiana]|uniref:Uncharacterized protein n=1 Tax=Sinanodonta woodiana TaxID=1069815 RepID=A0ABD3XXR4_SINWO
MGTLKIKHLVIFGTLIGLKQVNAIDCYNCGLLDSTCNDPFKTSGAPTVSCTGSCYKVKAKDSSSNAQAALRGCLPAVVAEDKCADSSYGGITGTVCSCRGNLCNYALPVGSSIIVITAALIVYVNLR